VYSTKQSILAPMIMSIKKGLIFLMPLILLSACFKKEEKKSNADSKAELIAAEISFSKLSGEKGSRKALMQFIDSNGVLLRPNSYPLVGGNAINFISQINDSAYLMNWQPVGAGLAESGELGYTYGVYTVSLKNKDGVMRGTYVNIWKKQADGSWKLLLDSGNQGVDDDE
jgi:ketosteroid isomerase-like protein